MKEAIAQLQVANTTDQLAALAWLKDLVRPIDNANGAPSSLFRSVNHPLFKKAIGETEDRRCPFHTCTKGTRKGTMITHFALKVQT